MELASQKPGWVSLLREHARRHTPAALGFGLALLGVLVAAASGLLEPLGALLGVGLMMVLDTTLG